MTVPFSVIDTEARGDLRRTKSVSQMQGRCSPANLPYAIPVKLPLADRLDHRVGETRLYA
jgi:hypothetical protein